MVAVARVQADRLGRHADGGAELLGLDHGPVGQLRAGDAGREAEVVLDPRRGAGLPAGGDRVERRPSPALPRRRTRRRRARPGPAPTTTRSASRRRRGRRAQADDPGQLGVARGCAAPGSRARSPRASRSARRRAAAAAPRPRVLLQVDPGVRQPVAGGELAQPAGVRRVPRPDDPDAGHRADQQLPAAQEGPQDEVAQLRVRAAPARAAPASGTASTSPGSRTTDDTNAGCPVSRPSSSRNRPGPWTLISRCSGVP